MSVWRLGGRLSSVLLGLAVVLVHSQALRAQVAPQQATQAAWAEFKKQIARPWYREFAVYNMQLQSADQLSSAILGEPYGVYWLSWSDLGSAQDSASLFAHATFVEYQFPIIIDGVARGTVGVALRDGAWTAVGGGGNEPILRYLTDAEHYKSRSLMNIGGEVSFAFVGGGWDFYVVPTNKSSAEAFGEETACRPAPSAGALRMLQALQRVNHR